jgi:hypothetical protein
MSSLYEKISDRLNLSIYQILALGLVSAPSYFIVKDCIIPKFKEKYNNWTCVSLKEEDILEAKVKSENLRVGPAFVYSHIYHNHRTERAKSAYTAVWSLVNQNLDLGNRIFKVAVADDDIHILNVVRRLLIDELEQDGYSATVTIHPMKNDISVDCDSKLPDDTKLFEYYLEISIL